MDRGGVVLIQTFKVERMLAQDSSQRLETWYIGLRTLALHVRK